MIPAPSSAVAPATMVSPSIATEAPSPSPAARSEAVSLAVLSQSSPARVNTYTAPRPLSSSRTPSTAVSPSTATALPSSSPPAPSGATRRCSSAERGAASARARVSGAVDQRRRSAGTHEPIVTACGYVVPMTSSKWTAQDLPDLDGRTYLVTGANSGIGLVAARELGRAGARVVMAVRDLAKGERAAASIGERAEVRPLDLADLGSVRAFAEEWEGDARRPDQQRRRDGHPRATHRATGSSCRSGPTTSAPSRSPTCCCHAFATAW